MLLRILLKLKFNRKKVVRNTMLKFPTWCYQCKTHISKEIESILSGICISCYNEFPFWEPFTCQKCGGSHLTNHCTESWTGSVNHFYSIFNYQPPISDWITGLKYSRNLAAGKILQKIIQHWLEEHSHLLKQVDVIFPVPLHQRRLRQRGFNQTTYLLEKQKLHPVNPYLLKRIRHTPHQAGLSKEERVSNLLGAFRENSEIKGKHILLFDDVLTTGNTIGEISKIFKQAGASEISVLVLSQASF